MLRILLANNISNIIIPVRIWVFDFIETFSTTWTSNNTVRWCAYIWPFRIYDKPKFSSCEVGMIFWILDKIFGRFFKLVFPACSYISKFMSLANLFYISYKDGVSIFALMASFMTDPVICSGLNSYHLLLFVWFLVSNWLFNASFCVIVIVS